jgi:demethylmenaquinone methyltransferase/2-methoxy-6-polyprenyl-1,4-benzoquinol methylase
VLDFGRPDNRLWRWLYFSYLRLLVPTLGRVVAGNAAAYAYILESLQHYPAQPGLTSKLHALGLNPVRLINLLGGVMSIHRADKPAIGPRG